MYQTMFVIFILLLLTGCQKSATTIFVNEHSQLIFKKKDSLFITNEPFAFIKINLVAFQFMELKYAHRIWKVAFLLFVSFLLTILGIFLL